jgi:hypothetical protein
VTTSVNAFWADTCSVTGCAETIVDGLALIFTEGAPFTTVTVVFAVAVDPSRPVTDML